LQTPLPEEAVTVTELLADAGYRTACWGKTHYNSRLKHGFQNLQGTPEHTAWLGTQGRQPLPQGKAVLGPWQPFRSPAREWLNADCLPYGAWDDEMADTYFAKQAADFIASASENPFFAVVSLTATHSPFRFPVEFRDRIDTKSLPLQKVQSEDDWQIPEEFRGLTDADRRGISAAYYTAAEFLDKNVGLLLDALQRSGQADSTVVVYVSDHGYMLGHHGRFEKHCSYEPAVRTPLIVRGPGVQVRGASDALVELIDVVPTVLELCGLKVPGQLQGQSFVPVLSGETDRHRAEIVVEYAPNEEVMISDGRWKLVYMRGRRDRTDGYRTGRPAEGPRILLFDLAGDPEESTNLAAKPQCRDEVDRLLMRLADHLVRTARDPGPLRSLKDPLEIIDLGVQPPEGHDD
jgi:choline-sulfatase